MESRGRPPVFIMLPAGRAACQPGGSVPAMGTAVKVLATAQFLLSLPCIFLGVAAFLFQCQRGNIATGVWTGVFVTVSGVLGIAAGSSKEQCPLTSYYMMSILNILVSIVLLTIQVLGILEELTTCADVTETCPALCLIVNTLLFSIGLAIFFLAMASSIVSTTLSSKIAKSNEQVVPLIPYPYGQQSHLQAPNDRPNDMRLREIDFDDDAFKFS